MRRAIYQAKPELEPAPAAAPAVDYLVVNRLWDNRSEKMQSGPNPDDLRGFGIDGRTIVTEGNSVWFIGDTTYQCAPIFRASRRLPGPYGIDRSRSGENALLL